MRVWGKAAFGGDSCAVQAELSGNALTVIPEQGSPQGVARNWQQIYSTLHAFAAVSDDGGFRGRFFHLYLLPSRFKQELNVFCYSGLLIC